ncbi:peroxiredoxin [Candidatus Kaiserbacteria bacterium CG10_big_fil_rev_8_21_14_0_10_56_12]|uniref:Peroxiredoxin n=1 Tax=Candidatus Kaiserbacteria bacterium CG10_big_fil_rev_8_21_14_0_10_56_12 TaxID=1974611 RepID=A0A2H0U9S3_9BACT|nr:MAG: peroxiredoxin [Candidatus Kaiserbacteria bacterium CG10_big_fil_rev_8_21_14_0_10_56_12]
MKETKSNYCEHCGEFHDAVRDYTAQVKVGEVVPDFEFETFHNGEVKTMSLSKLRGKWVVLVFYPADFTFVCPTELEELAKLYSKFQSANAEVISVSCDTVFTHKAWHDTSEGIRAISYPMAADPAGKLAYAFGTLIEGGEAELTPDEGLSLRGSFIIDPAGVLRSMEINDNSIGRKGSETLRKLLAAQYVESHKGQVCPASWEPGEDTLEPGLDLVGKL